MISVHSLSYFQGGMCFYCGEDTRIPDLESEAAAMKRLGITNHRMLGRRKATREHLNRKADGGGNRIENIVMACAWCNGKRGDKLVLIHLMERRQLSRAGS